MEQTLSSPPMDHRGWKQVALNALLGITLGFWLLSHASSCVEEEEHGLHDYLDDDKLAIITTSD